MLKIHKCQKFGNSGGSSELKSINMCLFYVLLLGWILLLRYTHMGKVFALLGGVWAGSDLEFVGSVWYNFY